MTRQRFRPASLRARVTLATGLLLAAVLVVAALATTVLIRRSLIGDVRADLTDQLAEIRVLARRQQLPTALLALGVRTGQVQVLDGSGKTIAASPGLASRDRLDVIAAPPTNTLVSGTVDGSRLGRRAGERFLIIAEAVNTPSGRLVIYGASSLRASDRAVHALVVSFLAGVPLLVVLAALLLWRSVRRALAPVNAMRAEVDDIGATSLDRRVAAPSRDVEIAGLAQTLNGLLARLDGASQRERRFAADASHELRSPLAAARTQLEVGLAYPGHADWVDTARGVLIEIERLESLARDLLRVATRDAAERVPFETVDLAALLHRESFACGHVDVEFHSVDKPLLVHGDEQLLVRVLRNVMSNARRHARSKICIVAARGGDVIVVNVSNDGPPIPEHQRERIFEPFARLDDARTTDQGGAGLGLAIARKIAEDHGGALIATATVTGASFELRLPSTGGDARNGGAPLHNLPTT